MRQRPGLQSLHSSPGRNLRNTAIMSPRTAVNTLFLLLSFTAVAAQINFSRAESPRASASASVSVSAGGRGSSARVKVAAAATVGRGGSCLAAARCSAQLVGVAAQARGRCSLPGGAPGLSCQV